MAIVGDAFAKPMLRALEEAEAKGTPYDISSLQLIISSGVMWSSEVKQAMMARGHFICFDSLGASEAVGIAGSITAPGARAEDGEVHDRRPTRRCSRKTAPKSCRVRARSAASRSAATSRSATTRTRRRPTPCSSRSTASAGRSPGDFASVETDGTITLLGRGSVVINSGGEKVFPEEVEEAVKVHPAVADCLVVGVPDERFGEAVTAVVALRPGTRRVARRPGRRARGAGAVQAAPPLRDRRRSRARPQRQSRLQVGQVRRRSMTSVRERLVMP